MSSFMRQLREQNAQYAGSQTASTSAPAPTVHAPAPIVTAPRPPPSARPLPTPQPLASPSAKKPLPVPPAKPAALRSVDWAKEHERAKQVFPELPFRRYEESSSVYVGGMVDLSLKDKAPAVKVESPRIEAPVIAVNDQPEASTSTAMPSIAINGDEESDARPSPSLASRSPFVNVVPRSTNGSSSLVCAACGQMIAGKILNAMGKRFHPPCFKCAQCETGLEHVAFHEREGQAYCHVDYHELFTIRCDHCNTPILDESYVTIQDEQLKRTFHSLHFFCAECGDPFIDPKSLDKASAGRSSEPKPFVVHKGHAYCEQCDVKLRAPKCTRCRKPIAGDVLSAMGKQWHDECFTCETCGQRFADPTFFVRDERPHCSDCQRDYLRRQM